MSVCGIMRDGTNVWVDIDISNDKKGVCSTVHYFEKGAYAVGTVC